MVGVMDLDASFLTCTIPFLKMSFIFLSSVVHFNWHRTHWNQIGTFQEDENISYLFHEGKSANARMNKRLNITSANVTTHTETLKSQSSAYVGIILWLSRQKWKGGITERDALPEMRFQPYPVRSVIISCIPLSVYQMRSSGQGRKRNRFPSSCSWP